MRKIIKAIFYVIAMFIYRIKVVGKENLPKDTAAIICANHVHCLDSACIIATAKRKINVLAKHDLFEKGIARWFAGIFGIYPVKRDSADMQVIKISLKLLKNQELLLIFPEATRNGMAKGVKPKNGPVIIAQKAGVPIIPIGVQGNFKIFRKVKINIGKPILVEATKEQMKDKKFVDSITENMMEEIKRLRDEKI